jgi:hypothetical protein
VETALGVNIAVGLRPHRISECSLIKGWKKCIPTKRFSREPMERWAPNKHARQHIWFWLSPVVSYIYITFAISSSISHSEVLQLRRNCTYLCLLDILQRLTMAKICKYPFASDLYLHKRVQLCEFNSFLSGSFEPTTGRATRAPAPKRLARPAEHQCSTECSCKTWNPAWQSVLASDKWPCSWCLWKNTSKALSALSSKC